MLETVFDTRGLPRRDRMREWQEMASETLMPTRVVTDAAEDFRADIRVLDLGAARLSALRHPTLEAHRTAEMIRRSDPEHYHLDLVRNGATTMEHGREQHTGTPGEMVLFGSWHPFVATTSTPGGPVSHILVSIPRTVLPVAPRQAERMLGRKLAADGLGAVLAGLLHDTVDSAAHIGTQEAGHRGQAIVDLVAAAIAQQAEALQTLSAGTRQSALLAAIHSFIDRHLADPELTPAAVATAHHVSVRYLHLLFQDQGTSVARWIQQRRLARCRRDLADPASAKLPIYAIAARWGFSHPEHFSRAFRSAFGVSPRDFREHMLRAGRVAG